MKRSKKLCVLLGVLAVVCVAAFAATRMEERKEQISSTGEIILEVSPDDVQSLCWEYGETSLAFHKDGDWLYDGDEAFPVDSEKVTEMLSLFEKLGVSFVIEDVTDYGMYGLDDPECVIEFSTAEQTYTVELGDFSKMDQERYISIGDGNVYLAKTDPLDAFDAVLDDLILHDRSLSYGEVSQISFEGMENYTVYREEDSENVYFSDDVYFTTQNGETVPLDTGRVETWLEALTTLKLTDYVTYNVTEDELAAYGLTEPELTITVDYTDLDGEAQTYTLSVSRDPEELAAAEESEANDEEPEDVTAYVRVGDSQIIYRVSEYSSDDLRAVSFNELRHREVLAADLETVEQIDVTLEGKKYTLLADGVDEDDARIWKYDGEEIGIGTLQNALEALTVEYAVDFTSDKASGKKEISLTIHLDSETRPTVQIDLYRQDGTHCLAVVDDAPLALVPRSEVVDIVEAVNAIVLS